MTEAPEPNPVPRIRAMFITGFITSDTCGVLYLLIIGRLWESITLNPLAVVGALLGVGLSGMLIGNLAGLSLRLLLGERSGAAGWVMSVAVAGVAAAVTGLAIAVVLTSLLWHE